MKIGDPCPECGSNISGIGGVLHQSIGTPEKLICSNCQKKFPNDEISLKDRFKEAISARGALKCTICHFAVIKCNRCTHYFANMERIHCGGIGIGHICKECYKKAGGC